MPGFLGIIFSSPISSEQVIRLPKVDKHRISKQESQVAHPCPFEKHYGITALHVWSVLEVCPFLHSHRWMASPCSSFCRVLSGAPSISIGMPKCRPFVQLRCVTELPPSGQKGKNWLKTLFLLLLESRHHTRERIFFCNFDRKIGVVRKRTWINDAWNVAQIS